MALLIAPSILSADFRKLAKEIEDVEAAGADWIHVDVMDGHFVPNLTVGPMIVRAVRSVSSLPIDSHLMIEHPEEYVEAYAKVRRMLAQHHAPKDFPLLNSERGYPLKKAEGWAGGPESEAPQYQAWHFVRQYLVDLLCDVRLTNWYEWTGEEFGIVRGKDRRPAYEACKVMLAQLDGYRLAKRMPTDAPADFVLLFEKESGEQKLVAWTSPPANQSPDRAKAHAVEIPAGAAGPLEVYDLYGKKSLVTVVDGKISLTLSGSPQYVVLQGKAGALPAPPK